MSQIGHAKSIELRLYEAAGLIKALESALARERGGGTPISHKAYIALRTDALEWVRQNERTE